MKCPICGEFDEENKVMKYKVAEGLKGLYLEYGVLGENEEGKQELLFSSKWDEKKTNLPNVIRVHLILWNGDRSKEFVYESFNLLVVSGKEKKKDNEKK